MDFPPPRPLPPSPRSPEGRVASISQDSDIDGARRLDRVAPSLALGIGTAVGLVWSVYNYAEIQSNNQLRSAPVSVTCYDVTWEGDDPLTVDQAQQAIERALPRTVDGSDLSPARQAAIANTRLIAPTFAELARRLPSDYSKTSRTIGYRAAVCADLASNASLIPAMVSSEAPTILVTEGMSFQSPEEIAAIVTNARDWQSNSMLQDTASSYRYDELVHAESEQERQMALAANGIGIMSVATFGAFAIGLGVALRRRPSRD